MPDEMAAPDDPAGRSCLGLPFVGERPLNDFERRRGEHRLARRRVLRWTRSAVLTVAGVIFLSWPAQEAHLDFYRDFGLSLLALGGVACLFGALATYRWLGAEVKNLRLDLADGRVERYERKASVSEADVVGQASILPRSRLEVGRGGAPVAERKYAACRAQDLRGVCPLATASSGATLR